MPKKAQWIEAYLKEKKLPTYKEYVASYAQDAEETYRDSLMRADTAYQKAKASYGTKNAALLSRGLNASGYSDYLDGAAYAAKSRATSEAASTYGKAENKNRTSYASFLEAQYQEASDAYDKREETLSSAFSKLMSAEISDEESAAEFLMGLGVDEENARSLAKRNTEIVRGSKSRRNSVLSYVLTNTLRYSRAYDYAIANGLSEEMAHEIATISQEARDAYYDNRDSDY